MTDNKKALDQGFDDSELEDIMNEIESLERDFDMMNTSSEVEISDPIMEEMAETAAIQAAPVMEDEPAPEEIVAETVEVPEPEEMVEETAPAAEMDPMDAALESALVAELEELATDAEDLHVESAQAEKTALQGVIDQEVDELLKEREFDELGESPISEAEAEAITMEPNVVEMTKPAPQPDFSDDFEPISESTPIAHIAPTPAPTPSAPADTEMSFSMSGSATIKLNFKISGQSINLSVSEGEGFVIEMAGGAKFTVPIQKADSWKKAC